jgi:hypothetical protein
MRPAGSFALALLGAASFFAAAAKPRPVSIPPIRYFDDKCARCHGSVESPDNSAFEHVLNDADLAASVKRMCDGPSQAPLDGANLRALTALVGARQRNRPFLCWTKHEGQKIAGETLRGTQISATVNRLPVKVSILGSEWSILLPSDAKPESTVITATLGEHTVALDLSQASFAN